MKKFMLFIAVAALALGAQAAESYTFGINLKNVPEGNHTGFYLVDKNQNKVIAFVDNAIDNVPSKLINHTATFDNSKGEGVHSGSINTPRGVMDVADHSVSAFVIGGTGSSDRAFTITFTSDYNVMDAGIEMIYVDGLPAIVAQNLEVYVTHEYDKYDVYQPIVTADTGAGTGTKSFNSFYSYGNVPEPTSGILLLFGVAGLALKRRRA